MTDTDKHLKLLEKFYEDLFNEICLSIRRQETKADIISKIETLYELFENEFVNR